MGGILNNPSSEPRGIIKLWYGSIATIPSGWQLCNGTNGTPDLRNTFIMCGEADDAGVVVNSWGLSNGGAVTHDHAVSVNGAGGLDGGSNILDSDPAGVWATGCTIAATGGTTSTIPDPQYPPYYVLAYIMKL